MLRLLILAVLAALFFYVILPVTGAFSARARWRAFRRRLQASLEFPRLDLKAPLRNPDTLFGSFQHYGSAEAIQGEDRVWTRGETVTAAACLKDAHIYLFPTALPLNDKGEYDLEAADESLKRTPWKRISGLEEGARLYIAGKLRAEGGLPVFFGSPSDPLLVLIYNGKDEDLPRRALWAGRHRNEYWNPVTLVSLTAGFLSTGAALYALLRPPLLSLPAALAAALAAAPVLPFLPPGLAFLSIYRRRWAQARRLRARRDLLRGGFSREAADKDPTNDRESIVADCVKKARKNEILAGLSLSAALIINFVLAVIVVRRIIR